MTVDCQWIEKNLEALFCDKLNSEESRLAREHIDSCGSCAKEVAALNMIDPLVKRLFQSELNRSLGARPLPRRVPTPALVGLSSALIAVSVLLFFTLRVPQQNAVVQTGTVAEQVAPASSPEAAPLVKSPDGTSLERAKPVEGAPPDRLPTAPVATAAPDNNAPDFLVNDPAGYSRTLNDYRGHALVIGVLNASQPDVASNLESLYKSFGVNSKLRFIGISNDRQARLVNTTFPVAYNQGSKLLGAQPGEFVLLDEAGTIQLRGSLVKDFETLRRSLQEK
jgi:hypothetical protein